MPCEYRSAVHLSRSDNGRRNPDRISAPATDPGGETGTRREHPATSSTVQPARSHSGRIIFARYGADLLKSESLSWTINNVRDMEEAYRTAVRFPGQREASPWDMVASLPAVTEQGAAVCIPSPDQSCECYARPADRGPSISRLGFNFDPTVRDARGRPATECRRAEPVQRKACTSPRSRRSLPKPTARRETGC